MTGDGTDYRPTRAEAIANLTRRAQELIDKRDPLELFDVKGMPKPMVPLGDGLLGRSPIAALHDLGIDQARDPVEWKAYLHEQFPAREEILKHIKQQRERMLRLALSTNLLSVRQTKAANAELRQMEIERTAA